MKAVWVALLISAGALGLAVLSYIQSTSIRVAHYDVRRVFLGYQHFRDLDAKRPVADYGHPGWLDEEHPELLKRYRELVECISRLDKKYVNKRDRDDDLEYQLCATQFRLLEGEVNRLKSEHGKALSDEIEGDTQVIETEIKLMVERLGKERGYLAVAPENGRDKTLGIVVTAGGDDLTEALIDRLNKEYATRPGK